MAMFVYEIWIWRENLKLLASIILFFMFWNELNKDRTAAAFVCLIIAIALLMWNLFEVWMNLADYLV